MDKTVGKKFRRALHFDFHTCEGIDNILGNFSAEKFAEQLDASHVEYINFFARCNMGFSYYNTKVGKKYDGLGERDVLREVLDACHKKGIGVSAYVNVGINQHFAGENVSWLKLDKDGRVFLDHPSIPFFRIMCYNSDYRKHLLAEMRELAEYDIDGIFCDCVSLRPCYCARCLRDMAARGFDSNSESDVIKYQRLVREELCVEIKEVFSGKGIKSYFNHLQYDNRWQTHEEIECLVTSKWWAYDHLAPNAAYARTLCEDRVFMSGRFQNDWGDFGGVKPLASMQNDLYDAQMNSCALSFGDHLHPVDGFEDEVAERVRAVFAEKMQYEEYTDDSDNIVEAGILKNRASGISKLHKGASRMLKELKIQYNIYNEDGDFDKLPLLFIGENIGASDETKARLRKYLANGGKIIFAAGGIELGVEIGALDFIEYVGEDTRDNAYYKTKDSSMRFSVYKPSRIIKNKSGDEIASDVDNVFNYEWNGIQAKQYFPQGNETENSAVVLGDSCACISFDIFNAYADSFLPEHKHLLRKLVDALLPSRLILSDELPQSTSVALTKNEKHLVFHVKSTYPETKMERGFIEEHTYIKSAEVSLAGEYRVFALPELTEIEARKENGRTSFKTPDILGYKAFLLK
jgi:hypothetical protein